MKTFSLKILFFLPILVCSHARLLSQQMISRSVFGCGGEMSSNSTYRINATLGQTLIGKITGTVNQKRIGFWYTIESIKVDVDELHASPMTFLLSNYPNPFSKRTTIRFLLPTRTAVVLEVFDMLGRKMATIANNVFEAGSHEVVFDTSDIESRCGAKLLYCTLRAQQVMQSLPMMVFE